MQLLHLLDLDFTLKWH